MTRRHIFFFAATLLAAPAAPAPTPVQTLKSLLRSPALRHASVAVLVRSLDTHKTLLAHNPDAAAIPASNQKLVTGAAGLALLGPDFRWRTRLLRSGDTLYLVGSGDPSLDSARLRRLADDARAACAGATRLVVDATVFPGPPLGAAWQWDDEAFGFSAQISGLVSDGGVLGVTIAPTTVGEAARVTLASPYGEVVGTVQTIAGAQTALTLDRQRGRNTFVVGGTIGIDAKPFVDTVSVEEPARLTGTKLAVALGTETLPIDSGTAPAEAQVVGESVSEPLAALLPRFLKPSDNNFGECLLRTIGAVKGKAGTDAEGLRLVRAWCAAQRLPMEGVALVDGSGLSMQNALTPRMLVALLERQAGNRAFVDALPVGGVDGTLAYRFKNTPAAGNVKAKTGTLTVGSSLSGYVTTRSGERLAFSILMNQFDRATGARAARAAQDALVLSLVDLPPR